MKTVILAGGLGTRLREETEARPKPLLEIGDRPILWHIMKLYAHHGFHDFVLCLGYRGPMIKEYFLNYRAMTGDFTISLGGGGANSLGGDRAIVYHGEHDERDWNVTLADTGAQTSTGGRLARVRRFLGDEVFMATYGDGLADVDLRALLEFHRAHGRVATLTTVRPPSPFGVVQIEAGGQVRSFVEKPRQETWASAGFFVFDRRVFDYLHGEPMLEAQPLERLAAEGQLMAYRHHGFFHAMDTYRAYLQLNDLWSSGAAPWRVWGTASDQR